MPNRFSLYLLFSLVVNFYCSDFAVAQSKPAFWRVADQNSEVYLLGSMHFGRNDFYPLPKEIESAYSRADALVVEVDLSSASPQEVSAALNQYASLKKGATLKKMIGADTYFALLQFCKKNSLPMASLEVWQPWVIALQLVQFEISKTALKADNGIDLYFLNKKAKPVISLESIDSQFSMFAGLNDKEQEIFLGQTLKDLQKSGGYLLDMADAWRNGDTVKLAKLLVEPFEQMDGGQKFFEKLFTSRNRMMAQQAENFLRDDKNVFFVVGAGHMLGADGIIETLRRKGFKVQRETFK